jgi:formate dehydrogenase iron-sulfur subunit
MSWYFVKRQCMHCNEPGCVNACKTGALSKLESGPVVLDEAKCDGCRDCMHGCPFQIPKFKWGAAKAPLRKCNFCADRQASGLQPSCSATCPTQALLFGERSRLIEEARRRITARQGKYVQSIFGEKTVGGTSMLYITAVPFEQMGVAGEGFRDDLGDSPVGKRSLADVQVPKASYTSLAVGGLWLGLSFLKRRREEVQSREGCEGKK